MHFLHHPCVSACLLSQHIVSLNILIILIYSSHRMSYGKIKRYNDLSELISQSKDHYFLITLYLST